MKSKKIAVVLAAFMSVAMVSTACGNQSATVKKQDLSKNNTQVIAATKPSVNPAIAKNRKDTLVVGNMDPNGNVNSLTSATLYDQYLVQLVSNGLLIND